MWLVASALVSVLCEALAAANAVARRVRYARRKIARIAVVLEMTARNRMERLVAAAARATGRRFDALARRRRGVVALAAVRRALVVASHAIVNVDHALLVKAISAATRQLRLAVRRNTRIQHLLNVQLHVSYCSLSMTSGLALASTTTMAKKQTTANIFELENDRWWLVLPHDIFQAQSSRGD